MPNLTLRRQYRKICHTFYQLRHLLVLILIVAVLFSIYLPAKDKYKSGTYNPSLKRISMLGKQLTVKDNYYLVTAVSSREFKWLLRFIDSLFIQSGEFELLIWSLDLRDCEFNYLKNLKTLFRIHLHRFPYHFHPLHIRYYESTAIKPIVFASAAVTFGEIIWIEPHAKLPLRLDNIIEILSDKGFIAASDSKSLHRECLTNAVGANYIRYKKFIEEWAECARDGSCIAEALSKHKGQAEPGMDVLFELHRKRKKFPCIVMENKVVSSYVESSGVLPEWESNEEELCQLHKACILTGKLTGCILQFENVGYILNVS